MKILIIRSAPIDQFQEAIKIVLSKYPNAEIYVLTHASTTAEVLDIHPVRVYNYTGRKISIFSLGPPYLKRLKEEEFNKVFILYSNNLGDNFDNVRFVSFCLGAREIYSINVKDEIAPIETFDSISHFLKEKLVFIYHGIIWVILFIKKKIKKYRNANRD